MRFCHRCCTCLVAADASESALRLFLYSALVIDKIQFTNQESMIYEFISQVSIVSFVYVYVVFFPLSSIVI